MRDSCARQIIFFYFHGHNSGISKLTFAFLISCIMKFWSTLQASALWVGWKTFQDSMAKSRLVKLLRSNMEASMIWLEDRKFPSLMLIFLIVLKMQLNTITSKTLKCAAYCKVEPQKHANSSLSIKKSQKFCGCIANSGWVFWGILHELKSRQIKRIVNELEKVGLGLLFYLWHLFYRKLWKLRV